MPENDFKTSSTVNFSKKRQDFGDLETNQRHEPQTRFSFFFLIYSYTYELNIIYKNWFGHLIGTYSKCHKY